jgi:pimeloyl-ACP methyl ester carboxylesterase
MTDFRTGKVRANGIGFHYLELGAGPLVLCLHGFPDNAFTYRYLLPALAEAGFRGVAPFTRGYAPTGRPQDERYQSVLLAQDAVALITAVGAEKAFVVGHDWGALATYGAAALAPERVHKIVTIAAAHPATLLGAMATNYDMIKGGWHAYFFQMPFAEQAVMANDYEFIERWWRDASPEYDLPREVIEGVKETFRQPGVVTAAQLLSPHDEPGQPRPGPGRTARESDDDPYACADVSLPRHQRPARPLGGIRAHGSVLRCWAGESHTSGDGAFPAFGATGGGERKDRGVSQEIITALCSGFSLRQVFL